MVDSAGVGVTRLLDVRPMDGMIRQEGLSVGQEASLREGVVRFLVRLSLTLKGDIHRDETLSCGAIKLPFE